MDEASSARTAFLADLYDGKATSPGPNYVALT